MIGNVWYINGKFAANILPAFHPNDPNCRDWDEDQGQVNMDAAKPIFTAIYGVDPDLRHSGSYNYDHQWISNLKRLGFNEDDYFHIAQADYMVYRKWTHGAIIVEVFPYTLEGADHA